MTHTPEPEPAPVRISRQANHGRKDALAILKPTWGKAAVLALVGGQTALWAGGSWAQLGVVLTAVPLFWLAFWLCFFWTERSRLLDLANHLIDSTEEFKMRKGDLQIDFKARQKLEIPVNTRSRDDPPNTTS